MRSIDSTNTKKATEKEKTTKVLTSAGNPIPRGLSNLDGYTHSINNPRLPVNINYAHIKQSITTRQAAENFGIQVNSHSMAVCPFHDDHNPSMKMDDNFYCFGCGATGDVITFTSRLLGISNASAARQLARDFGISAEEPSEYSVIPKSQAQKDFENWCHFASEIIRRYNQLLFEWKFLAPNDPGEDFHFLFVEALQNSARVKHLLCTLAFGSVEEKRDIYLTCREEVKKIYERIQAYEHSGS